MILSWRMVGVYVIFAFVIRGQTVSDLKSLINDLFETRGYDKRIRPATNLQEPVEATIDFSLTGINDFDRVSQKLTTTGYLYVWWDDEFLTWTKAAYGGLTDLMIPQNDVWKPDIALQNSYNKLQELGDKFLNVRIDSDGGVFWYPYQIFITTCDVNIRYFPFDKQICELQFLPWSSSIYEVNLTMGSRDVDLERYETNGEWNLISATIRNANLAEKGVVIITLSMERKPLYYILNMVIPVTLLSLLNVFVFLLPADSGEKISFSITVFLAFAVFLTIVSSSIPKNSNVTETPIFGIYLLLLEIISTLVLISTVLLLRLFHRDPEEEIRPWLRKLVMITRKLRCKKPMKINPHPRIDDVNVITKPESKQINWPEVTHALDYLFFWLFIISLLIMTTVIMLILSNQ